MNQRDKVAKEIDRAIDIVFGDIPADRVTYMGRDKLRTLLEHIAEFAKNADS